MFEDILIYINKPLADRQQHLDLKSPCLCIGGTSQEFRGTLSHFLKTTIPKGMKIHLCHACYNEKCSNPTHLYWGTPTENAFDTIQSGRRPKTIVITNREKILVNALRNLPKMKEACRGSVWVNNGSIDLRMPKDKIPDGFVLGRLWKPAGRQKCAVTGRFLPKS